jgi:nucleoside-diphosphate-sugar epimerase
MNIDGSAILVTGGCGFIGSTTIDRLLRAHHPARIVVDAGAYDVVEAARSAGVGKVVAASSARQAST